MLDSTSVNSSGEFGTHATSLGRKEEFICRCCNGGFYGFTCWEWRDGNWVCEPCARLLTVMFEADQQRCTKALAFLDRPREIRTGWTR